MSVSGEQRPEYFEFASKILNDHFEHGPSCKCVTSLSSSGEILGVVIYNHMTLTGCMMSVASDGTGRFLTRQYLKDLFSVPFVQWNKRRVSALIRESNRHSIVFNQKVGFVKEGVVRYAYGNEHGILFGMLKEECRFLDYKR